MIKPRFCPFFAYSGGILKRSRKFQQIFQTKAHLVNVQTDHCRRRTCPDAVNQRFYFNFLKYQKFMPKISPKFLYPKVYF